MLILILLLVVLLGTLSAIIAYLRFGKPKQIVEVYFMGGADAENGRLSSSSNLFKGIPPQYDETITRGEAGRRGVKLYITNLNTRATDSADLYDSLIIGRYNQNGAYVINEASVSKAHCELYRRGGRILVRDLGSSNRTYIDGELVSGEAELRSGSTLKLGNVYINIRFRI